MREQSQQWKKAKGKIFQRYLILYSNFMNEILVAYPKLIHFEKIVLRGYFFQNFFLRKVILFPPLMLTLKVQNYGTKRLCFYFVMSEVILRSVCLQNREIASIQWKFYGFLWKIKPVSNFLPQYFEYSDKRLHEVS